MGPRSGSDAETTLAVRRYDRIAGIYDVLEGLMELRARRWRRELWSRVEGDRILELGVGTGKNLAFYPPGPEIVAMDLSPNMLARARRRAERKGIAVRLELGDAQRLEYADASFDVVVATFLFCSVPDPVLGLHEARRVLRPGGQLLLLEHVLSEHRILRPIMRWIDPVSLRLFGSHVARDTVASVHAAGFVDVEVEDLALDIVKHIRARAPCGAVTRAQPITGG